MGVIKLTNTKVVNHEGYAALPLARIFHTEAEVVADWEKRIAYNDSSDRDQIVRVTWTEVLSEVLP